MAEDSVPEEQDKHEQPVAEGEAPQHLDPAPEPTIKLDPESADTSSEDGTESAEPSAAPVSSPAVDTADSDKWQAHAKAAHDTHKEKFARFKDFFHAYWAKKKWTLPVTVVALLVLLLAVPLTRYKLLGVVWKHDVTIKVVDSVTSKPVSGAKVVAGGKSGATDGEGQVSLHVPVGPQTVAVAKKYYKAGSVKLNVGLFGSSAAKVSLVATGRQVPIAVTNKLTGKGVAGVHLAVLGTDTQTDKSGKATLVLPVTASTQSITLSLNGYNTFTTKVEVTDQAVSANTFEITPSGKLYFLSNLSGTIDVVKTNLDGSDRHTVLAGTGKEDPNSTALLASRDWQYLALLSNRSGTPGIYLINTTNDQVTNIDGGSSTASFSLVGWDNHVFVYQVTRSNVQSWQSGAEALKSYDADAGKLYSLDQTTASGTDQSDWIGENIGGTYIIDNQVIYSMNWSAGFNDFSQLNSKSATLDSISATGANKKVVKSFTLDSGTQSSDVSIQLRPYEPNGLYIYFPSGTQDNFYDYDDGQVTNDSKLTSQTYYTGTYDTYLESPSGNQTFWSDVRDNKNTLFVGDADGKNGKQIATLSDYTPYGWYTDNYLLVTKNGSELFIMPADGSKTPLKISDYYKPQLSFPGYGSGYGGGF